MNWELPPIYSNQVAPKFSLRISGNYVLPVADRHQLIHLFWAGRVKTLAP